MTEQNLLEAVRSGLHEAMARDPRVLVLGEDVGPKGGVFGATKGLFQAFGAGRVIDAPLAESAIVGVAIGRPPTASCRWWRSSSPTSSSPP